MNVYNKYCIEYICNIYNINYLININNGYIYNDDYDEVNTFYIYRFYNNIEFFVCFFIIFFYLSQLKDSFFNGQWNY